MFETTLANVASANVFIIECLYMIPIQISCLLSPNVHNFWFHISATESNYFREEKYKLPEIASSKWFLKRLACICHKSRTQM